MIHIGLKAFFPAFGQAQGPPDSFIASAKGKLGSQERATNLMSVKSFDKFDASQQTGGPMTYGCVNFNRSNGAFSGIKPVFTGPPGTSTLAVTPVPFRSLAHTEVAASSAAFDGP